MHYSVRTAESLKLVKFDFQLSYQIRSRQTQSAMREIEYAANYAIANYSQEQQPQLESQNLSPGNSCQRLGNLRIFAYDGKRQQIEAG